jgi:hypothetical protein
MFIPLLALSLLTSPSFGSEWQSVFPSRTVASQSGAWSLYFEPHMTNGLRGADYRMTTKTSDGSNPIAWKGRREFTLRDPIVTDRGWAYGWAIVHGPGEDARAKGGTVRIVALDAGGKTIVEDRIEEVPPGFGCMGPAGGPWVLGLVPLEADNALMAFVNMTERTHFEEDVWVYDLDSGKRSATFTPFPSVRTGPSADQITRLFDVVAIRETPLVLVHGMRKKYPSGNDGKLGFCERWALFDTGGVRVWQFDDVDDPRVEAYSQADEIKRSLKPRLRSDTTETFSFWMHRTETAVSKQVRKGDDGHWIVEDAPPVQSK